MRSEYGVGRFTAMVMQLPRAQGSWCVVFACGNRSAHQRVKICSAPTIHCHGLHNALRSDLGHIELVAAERSVALVKFIKELAT